MQTEGRAVGRPFKPGQSGNPGGRPKQNKDGRKMLREALPGAVQAVIDVLNDPEAKTAERLTAAKIILDRVLGKAIQPMAAEVYTPEITMSLSEMLKRARELIAASGDNTDG